MADTLKLAVRTLVAHVLRTGDLNLDFMGSIPSTEGIRAHQKIQRRRPPNYLPEVAVTHEVDAGDFRIEINGRIDGVYQIPGDEAVEEIKSTTRDLDALDKEQNPLHWGQLKTYAYLYAAANNLSHIGGRLVYYQIDTDKTLTIQKHFTLNELETFFKDLVDRYLQWARTIVAWEAVRDASIRELTFPFDAFRPGQREMAASVFRAVRDNRHLLAQAATGIGKTMAAIFGALKARAETGGAVLFYLTARTTGRMAAESAFQRLRSHGLHFKTVSLTAKEKICFEPESACTPEECPYAKGHFDRINAALSEVFENSAITRDIIEETSRQHCVCPFEFSLDIALWADGVICDYNYAFDPRVYLRRFFSEETTPYVFLIDEAHNLVDRSRDMFSAQIEKKTITALRQEVKKNLPNLYRTLGRIDRWLLESEKICDEREGDYAEAIAPEPLYPMLTRFVTQAERWLRLNIKVEYRRMLLEVFFAVSGFLKVAEKYDAAYATCYWREEKNFFVKLFCMDPSIHLSEALKRCRSAVFFSATMAPAGYFKEVFGCEDSVRKISLPSSFPRENFGLFVADDISVFYKDREKSKIRVAKTIITLAENKCGNHLVFFPSYAYMTMIHEMVSTLRPEMNTLVQSPQMTEPEREKFLERFHEKRDTVLVGFAVMGGIFGEGVDLVGDRLSSAVIVGVGLPGICLERELIREYFQKKNNEGFAFAYLYPGMNRVLQAAGRVIRSETDKGVVLLIDRRFATARYRSLFPPHWIPVRVGAAEQLAQRLKSFWRGI